MNNGSNWIVWLVVAVVVIGGGWWLLSSHPSSTDTSTGPIKIGFIGPLTGDTANLGQPMQQTVQMAVDQINANGGINGRQLEVSFQDGKCTGQDAASAAQELISVEGVQAIIGGACSGEALAAVPIATQSKVFLFSPSASSPALTGISKYFARDYPSDSAQGQVLATLANSKGWKTVAFIQEQTDYAAGIYKIFNDNFSALGGATTNDQFPTTATDFRSILAKIKAANPDAVFIDAQSTPSADRILQQIQALGWKPQIITNDADAGDPTLITKYATLLEGAVTAEFIPAPTDPNFAQFISDFKTKYNVDPPYQGYLSATYDAVNLLAQGIAKVGDNGTKLAAWSRTISNYQGASGSISIDANGDRTSGFALEIVHNGVKQPLQQ